MEQLTLQFICDDQVTTSTTNESAVNKFPTFIQKGSVLIIF